MSVWIHTQDVGPFVECNNVPAAAKWLRYKSFTVYRPLTNKQVESKRLPSTIAGDVAVMLPFLRWLNAAVGYRPRTSRL